MNIRLILCFLKMMHICNVYNSYAYFCCRVAYSKKGQRILCHVYISQLWLCSTSMPKRPAETTHTLCFTVIRTSHKITANSALILEDSYLMQQFLKTVKTCHSDSHLKKKKTIYGPHFTLGFDDDFNGNRKLFYFSYVMNFWVKQDTYLMSYMLWLMFSLNEGCLLSK